MESPWFVRAPLAALILAIVAVCPAVDAQVSIANDPSLVEACPAVAYNSTRNEFLVVWYNDRAGNDDIRAQRLAADTALLGTPFYISAGSGADRRYPDVTYDVRNDQYLVVWEHYDQSNGYGIHARRVSGGGMVADASDIEIASAATLSSAARPAVAYAFTSDRYMVVWQETWHPLPITYSIEAQVVTPAGALDGPTVTVTSNSSGDIRSLPDLAYNRRRNEYLVVWQQLASGVGLEDVYGRRITAGGTLLGGQFVILYYTASSLEPAVSAIPTTGTDGQYLVAGEIDYAPSDHDIYSRSVAGDGVVGTEAKVSFTNGNEAAPAVAASEDTQLHLVAWANPADPPPAAGAVYGRAVDTAPTALGSGDFRIAGTSANRPAIASGPSGTFLVVFEDTPAGGSTGVYGALWGALFVSGFESGDVSAWSATVP